MNQDTGARGAGACTVPADLAQQIHALLNDRDKLRDLWERNHVYLVHALQDLPRTDAARTWAARAWACMEAADLAADAALRLALDALQCCGVVVDVAPASDDEPADADAEGIEP